MAIYSLNLRSIGKTTQKAPYTATAALRYIARRTACEAVISQHCPPGQPGDARAAEEKADRKNARVTDRIIIALPRELSPREQAETVIAFMKRLGKGRVPWIAGMAHRTERRPESARPYPGARPRHRDPQASDQSFREERFRCAPRPDRSAVERLERYLSGSGAIRLLCDLVTACGEHGAQLALSWLEKAFHGNEGDNDLSRLSRAVAKAARRSAGGEGGPPPSEAVAPPSTAGSPTVRRPSYAEFRRAREAAGW